MKFEEIELLEGDFVIDGVLVHKVEEWREYHYPDYVVSTFGRVWSKHKSKFVGSPRDPNGYFAVSIRDICRTRYAHVMVLETFGPPRPSDGHEVDHIDNNSGNNCLWNLQWLTHKENIRKSYAQGRKVVRGDAHWKTGKKVSEEVRLRMAEKKKEYWRKWREVNGLDPNVGARKQKRAGKKLGKVFPASVRPVADDKPVPIAMSLRFPDGAVPPKAKKVPVVRVKRSVEERKEAMSRIRSWDV